MVSLHHRFLAPPQHVASQPLVTLLAGPWTLWMTAMTFLRWYIGDCKSDVSATIWDASSLGHLLPNINPCV